MTELADAWSISDAFSRALDLDAAVGNGLGDAADSAAVDVIAIGKAAAAMAASTDWALGRSIARRFVVVPEGEPGPPQAIVHRGEHPRPGPASARAGRDLLAFVAASQAAYTVFLVSGGASSLCVAPEPPLTLDDLGALFDLSVTLGLDITTLNRLRAATSSITGGAVLCAVKSARIRALIMVDNAVSGPRWVASGLTYDYQPDAAERRELGAIVARTDDALGARFAQSAARRAVALSEHGPAACDQVVVAEPADVLRAAGGAARSRGYEVVDLGVVSGASADLADRFTREIAASAHGGRATCIVAAGEVTTPVPPGARGGRCQHLAALMAEPLAVLQRRATFVARATDGRDCLAGVGGAWIDETTMARATERGLDWSALVRRCDSHVGHDALGQLLAGAPTGWNLCDVYVACVAPG